MALVECIANFSEGRRPEVIAAIRDAIAAVPGVQLLDVQSDADHNRTVISWAGPPAAVGEAAFAGVRAAQGLISLDEHRGAHPRLGAADVIPFVPLRDVTMAQCVALARAVGKRIGEELGIAVYLYEEAATRPERRNLADVRKGEYEKWKKNVARDPGRAPDFGPAKATPAGATVVGARPPLIAYNVYLNSDNLEIASAIAKSIRFMGGGLRFVKALGLLVDGRAQISMNLVNYQGTPIHRVVELIRAEAARYGLAVAESEIVGLVPQDALLDAAEHYLQLNHFRRDQVLEQKLAAAAASDGAAWVPEQTLRTFAAGKPTPGGGSAAALAGALAASLGQMVANLTVGRKKYAKVEGDVRPALERLERAAGRLSGLAVADSAAFDELMKAGKAGGDDEAANQAAVQAATVRAAQVPLEVAGISLELMDDLALLAAKGNKNARTDAQVGAYLAHAALMGACLNIEVNVEGIEDPAERQRFGEAVARLRREAAARLAGIIGA